MNFKDWRHNNLLTQTEAVQLLQDNGAGSGIDQPAMSRWENGESYPSANSQKVIYKVTKGEVTPNDWILNG